ncbi:MAG: regulatory iron-sulfur-containing complex subunit RicT [Caldilineaceae bacterium]|nr:regulatory iron-sulfur-containing complex subunit RicT [Caldilineaceae bacterium]MCZ0940811.1 regulatory iron-sulfur-containing complex subunit RicT [Caldilineaceae bacterium]
MPTVVGAQFKPVTKIYFFDPVNHMDLAPKDYVIVDTVKGRDLVQIVQAPHDVPSNEIVGDIKKVVRRATPWDLLQKDLWKEKQAEAVSVCREKAKAHRLDIKVHRCEYNYEGGRLTVYFAAEQRVDFRALVRDLARTFHTRIEMRQIGVRDEAKLLDGVGKCGRQLCCTSWLREFASVSIRQAKNQQLPLNQDEISGVCGRLLCCLSYEDPIYKKANKKMPKVGAEVTTHQGKGRIRHLHPLKESVTVLLENNVLAEFGLSELITGKKEKDGGCGTCGGCTVKRRAGEE